MYFAGERGLRMILYHGSYSVISKPDVIYSRERLDFGAGFYLTNIYEQAKNWATRFRYRKCPCIVNVFELDYGFVQKKYRVKIFESYDKEWLHFIIRNREGQEVEEYDVIIGGVANDKVFNTIELFRDGLISEEETLGRLKYEKPNWQMCIRNQEILDNALKFQKSEVVMDGSK